MDTSVFVEYIEPPVEPHEPKKILDCHELRTCHHVCHNKFLLSGKTDLTKVPLGKTLALYKKGFLILFLRMKTL